MLEEECHKLDIQLASTYSESTPTSFATYSQKFQELQSGKAELKKRLETQHVMEQLATYMSIQNAEPSDVIAYLLQQCEDNRQAMTTLVRQKHSIAYMYVYSCF